MKADGVECSGKHQSQTRYWRAFATPPGSWNRACTYRGSSGYPIVSLRAITGRWSGIPTTRLYERCAKCRKEFDKKTTNELAPSKVLGEESESE